jgi:hypothetical protein
LWRPINLTLEALGDRWSLIVISDLMFGNRRHFRELLTRSKERIASNILADRLRRLEEAGLVSRRDDHEPQTEGHLQPNRKRDRAGPPACAYGGMGPASHASLERAFGARVGSWRKAARSFWSQFMKELRHIHLGARRPKVSVFAQLQAAYELQ